MECDLHSLKWMSLLCDVGEKSDACFYYLNKKPIWIQIIHFNCIACEVNHERWYFSRVRQPFFSFWNVSIWYIYSSFYLRWSFFPTRTEKEKEKEEISLLYVHRFLDLYKHTYLWERENEDCWSKIQFSRENYPFHCHIHRLCTNIESLLKRTQTKKK